MGDLCPRKARTGGRPRHIYSVGRAPGNPASRWARFEVPSRFTPMGAAAIWLRFTAVGADRLDVAVFTINTPAGGTGVSLRTQRMPRGRQLSGEGSGSVMLAASIGFQGGVRS
nr:hypothetical protein Ade03nite_44690 [Actinoplanes derwentensis]